MSRPLPAKVTITGALNQLFAFGCRSGVAVTTGAVASYLSVLEEELSLPALSGMRHSAIVDCVSGPEYVFACVAGVDPGGCVGACEGDDDRGAVPAFRVRWRTGVALVSGAVASYLSAKDLARVSGLVEAGSPEACVRAVRAGVGLRRIA